MYSIPPHLMCMSSFSIQRHYYYYQPFACIDCEVKRKIVRVNFCIENCSHKCLLASSKAVKTICSAVMSLSHHTNVVCSHCSEAA